MDDGHSLKLAREAFQAGNYSESLRLYEYFFDQTFDDESGSFYGVRLSYCLSEWARLGRHYPDAKVRLEQKAEESLGLFDKTQHPERFHDYLSIHKYLKSSPLALQAFLDRHKKNPALAATIVSFIWDKLISEGQWSICSHYVTDSKAAYGLALDKYDEATSVSLENPQFGGEEFNQQIRGWYIRDVTNLLLVLLNSDREAEADDIRQSARVDMDARDQEAVVAAILSAAL